MRSPRRHPTAAPGALVAAVTAAGLVATAALVTAATDAAASPVSDQVSCQPPPLDGSTFTWNPQVDLVLSPQKAVYSVGDKVTVTWHWVTYPRNPSDWVLVLGNSATPTGTVELTGAQTADVAVTGPAKNPITGPSSPLAVSDMTGTFTVTTAGAVSLAPAGYSIVSSLSPMTSPCTPTGTPAVAATLQVGTPGTPGGTGGTAGTPGGGTASPSPGATDSPGTAVPGATPTGPDGSPLPTALPGLASLFPGGAPGSTSDGITLPGAGLPGSPAAGTPAADPVPGPLYMTQQDAGATFSPYSPSPAWQNIDGALNPVTVTDDRGSSLGWSLTGQVSDFTPDNGQGASIPANRLTWWPTCVPMSTSQAGAVSGEPTEIGSVPAVLCQQVQSTGAVTSGQFQAQALLTLQLPPQTSTQGYTATLTLSLS